MTERDGIPDQVRDDGILNQVQDDGVLCFAADVELMEWRFFMDRFDGHRYRIVVF